MSRTLFARAFAARLAACLAAAVTPWIGAGPAAAQDGSLAVCADLKAKAGDVAHHCRRALRQGGLSEAQSFGAQVNLGEALISLGQPSQAVDAFNEANALRPDRVEPLIGRASALEDLGRMGEAARDWLAALRLAPNSVDARIGKGAFHLRTNAAAAALKEFDAAVRLDPEAADARFNRGLAYLALGQAAPAEADFSAVLADHPSDAAAYFNRGRARAEAGDGRAIADYDQAINLAPEWPEPWYLSGLFLDGQGRRDEANQRFRRAFELGSKAPWLLERITSLGG